MRIDTGNSRVYLVERPAGERRRLPRVVRVLGHIAFTLAVAVAAALLVLDVAAWRGSLVEETPGQTPQGASTAFVPQVGGAENVLRSQITP